MNKARLIERIADLVQNKKVEGIADVRDESDREGMRIVIEVKRGEEPDIILNNLYKYTQMQESFGMILLAIVGGQPREMGLVEILRHFIEHRVDVVRRRTQFDLRKAEEREHILVGFKLAVDNVEQLVLIIRGSGSKAQARENLHKWSRKEELSFVKGTGRNALKAADLAPLKQRVPGFDFSDAGDHFGVTGLAPWEPRGDSPVSAAGGLSYAQIDAILELQLHRLTQLSVDEILKELEGIRVRIGELKEILASDRKLRQVIVGELKEIQKEYGDERRTQIVERVEEIQLEDLIADEDMAITVSHSGYIKRTPVDVYRHQSRGGKGRIGARTREQDFVEHLFVASAHSYILLFTSHGRVYWLKVYEIPEAAAATRGKAIHSLLKFQEGEKLAAVVPARNLEEEGRFVFLGTRKGTVKKTRLAEFSNPRPSGIIAINLEKGDELIGARITDGRQLIFLASRQGQAILFRETEVRPMGRPAAGVNGMGLAEDDWVVGMDAVQPDFEVLRNEFKAKTEDLGEIPSDDLRQSLSSLMLTISEKGFGKRTPLAEYRIISRGGKGVINLKSTERNGPVVGALQVGEESDVMIITEQGKIIRVHAAEIREAGRSTQGVHLLRLEDGDRVAAAAVILENGEESANGGPADTPPASGSAS